MLEYVEITKENVEFATRVQMKIFPKECAFEHYLHAIESNKEYIKNYLVYDSDSVVGITGLYSNEDIFQTNSIWLGWFGVLEEYRSRGYGKMVLLDTINMAKELSLKYPIYYFRLYTLEKDDYLAQPLYNKIMDMKEYYNNSDDINYDGTCLIYTKALGDAELKTWNNRFLNLSGIANLQELGSIKLNKKD